MSLLAADLRALHVPGHPVVLPNAWAAGSARAVEAARFPAVATASAAIAPVLGYPDHEGTPAEEMFAAVARIVRAVNVPISADLEHGYGILPEELVARIAETGAVGCNLEDTDPAMGQLVEVERPDSRPFVRNVRHRVGRYLDLTALWFVQAHSDVRGWLLNFKGASQMGIEGDR